MKNFILFLFLLFLLAGCQSTKMVPGLYWEQLTYKVSSEGDTSKINQKLFLIPNRLRTEVSTDYADSFTIIQLDSQIALRGNPIDSSYSRTTFEEITKSQELRKENVRRMRAQMDTLPPNLRRLMEMDMGVKWQPEIYAVIETGEKKNISGLNCEKFIVTNRDSLEGEYWVTNDLGSMDQYGKDWLAIMEKTMSLIVFEKFKMLYEKGFIVASEIKGTHLLVTKVEKKLLPDNLFYVPEYYNFIQTVTRRQSSN
ncbi:MAG: DUF4412 domain-containing protein [Bacteroidota bacterium]|nr:DUF4412 domain-containing protein [Bacteroidota bacterium]